MRLTIRLRNLLRLAFTLYLCIGITSCAKETEETKKQTFNKSMLVGEWKAIEIEATFINGKVSTYTDPSFIESELEEMYWIDVTEEYIHPERYSPWNVIPYELTNNRITFEGHDGIAAYELVSVTNTEMVVRYTETWTSLITYKKVEKEPINKKMLIGEWAAKEVNSYGYIITDQEKIQQALEGFEWITLSENTITIMSTGVLLPYSINEHLLVVTLPDLQRTFSIESVTDNEIVVHSLEAIITYQRVTKRDYNISGKVEKGPFSIGTSVSIEVLDSKLRGIGKVYNTEITDNLGSYSYDCNDFTEPYVELKTNGYFYNEMQDALSNGTITLKAVVDLSKSSNININVLTHLKAARIKNLVASGVDFTSANEQAQKELLDAFGLSSHIKNDVSSISMTDGTDEAAALIAISSLILMDRSDAELAEYIATLCSDFGELGYFSSYTKSQINDDIYYLAEDLPNIKENLINKYQSLGTTVSINNLFRHIDWNNDGTAGNELLKEGESVIVEPSIVDIPADGGEFTVQITSPIRVYMESQVYHFTPEVIIPGIGVGDNGSRATQSETSNNNGIQYECSIDEYDNSLHINAAPLGGAEPQTKQIELYDYVGNVVATVELRQQANPARIEFDVTTSTSNDLSYFDVYGSVKNNNGSIVAIFDGAEIIRNSSNGWDYKYESEVEYWKSSSEYYFAAVSNATKVTTENGLPSLIHFTSDGDTDLLYTGTTQVYTDDKISNKYVSLSFASLLSDIEFEFENNTSSGLTCKVSNIRINGVNTKGIYDVNTDMWAYDGERTTNLYFGNATNSTEMNAAATSIEYGSSVFSNYKCKAIPGTQTVTITYDYELYNGTNRIVNKTIESNPITVGFNANSLYRFIVNIQTDTTSIKVIYKQNGENGRTR